MHAEAVHRRPKTDQAGAIETQSRNRGAPRRSDAYDLCCIVAPSKMLRPFLLSRMKQGRLLFRCRIDAGLERAFKGVASQTRERKVCFVRGATFGCGLDVFNSERI